MFILSAWRKWIANCFAKYCLEDTKERERKLLFLILVYAKNWSFKRNMVQTRPLFVYFRPCLNTMTILVQKLTIPKWKKHSCCARDSNPGPQDGRRGRRNLICLNGFILVKPQWRLQCKIRLLMDSNPGPQDGRRGRRNLINLNVYFRSHLTLDDIVIVTCKNVFWFIRSHVQVKLVTLRYSERTDLTGTHCRCQTPASYHLPEKPHKRNFSSGFRQTAKHFFHLSHSHHIPAKGLIKRQPKTPKI